MRASDGWANSKDICSMFVPLHVCRPGRLTILRSAVQARRAPLCVVQWGRCGKLWQCSTVHERLSIMVCLLYLLSRAGCEKWWLGQLGFLCAPQQSWGGWWEPAMRAKTWEIGFCLHRKPLQPDRDASARLEASEAMCPLSCRAAVPRALANVTACGPMAKRGTITIKGPDCHGAHSCHCLPPLGGGRLGGRTDCLGSSRPMSSAGYDFRKFGNRLLRESLSYGKPLVLS